MNGPAFWDASALVPLCVIEAASPSAASHIKNFAPVVWWGTLIEVHGAICRLHRDKVITDSGKQESIARLEALSEAWREIPAGDRLRELAIELLGVHSLKAADGLQLAASLIWCEERPARRNFVCSDRALQRAARSVGFFVLELNGTPSRP
jgi:predicted nucleic acid-binding protein